MYFKSIETFRTFMGKKWGLNLETVQKIIELTSQFITGKVKVRQSHYRPGQTLRVPGGWGSQISRQSTHEGGRVVSPTHQTSLPPQEIFLVLISVRDWVDPRAIVRPEGLCQWKMTPSGIELATFWFVAQCVNKLRHRVPPNVIYVYLFTVYSVISWVY